MSESKIPQIQLPPSAEALKGYPGCGQRLSELLSAAKNAHSWLYTCHDHATELAIAEVKSHPSANVEIQRLGPGLFRATYQESPNAEGAFWLDQEFKWCRHRHPVLGAISIDGPPGGGKDASDGEGLSPHPLVAEVAQSAAFSDLQWVPKIQVRRMGSPVSVTGGQFAHGLAQLVQAAEGSSDWIFSVTMAKNHIYWGYGQASQQISGRSGGAYHYPSSELRYSRAAGKLLEAFEVFGLKPPGANSEANSSPPCALDLGAAPGGWTGVLVSKGFHVWAVDPSPLHPELASQPQVKHLATTTDRLTSKDFSGRVFQLITCDANWDALAAQKAVLDLASHLVQGGEVLFTLKLIHSYGRIATHPPSVRAVNDMVAKTRDVFARVYRVTNIRQLFHNRAEISFHLQKL